MLNSTKQFLSENRKDLTLERKLRLINVIKKMEGSLDLLEYEAFGEQQE